MFIPYTKIFEPPAPLGPATSTGNEFIHGLLTSLKMHPEGKNDQFGRGTASYIRLSSTNEPLKEVNGNTNGSASNGERPHEHSVSFDYLVYALGSHLPPPINIWSVPDTQKERAHGSLQDLLAATGQIEQKTKVIPGSKSSGMTWLQDAQKRIRDAKSIAIIGGGPLGVRECLWLKCIIARTHCLGQSLHPTLLGSMVHKNHRVNYKAIKNRRRPNVLLYCLRLLGSCRASNLGCTNMRQNF